MPNAILWTVNLTLTEQTTHGYLVQNSDNRAARMAATNSYADRLKHDSDKLTIVEPVYLKSTAMPHMISRWSAVPTPIQESLRFSTVSP